ncbi:hypothetical protein ACK3YV_19455 [Aeromonas caviae]
MENRVVGCVIVCSTHKWKRCASGGMGKLGTSL